MNLIWQFINRNKWFGIVVILLIMLTTFNQLKFYLLLDGNLLMVFILAPFIIVVNPNERGRWRWSLPSFLFFALYLLAGLQTFYFLGVGFALFYFIEQYFGALNKASVMVLILCSPLVTYLIKVWGFDIRLYITTLVVRMLNAFGMNGNAMGNTIQLDGGEYTVEPACTGIKLVIVSLLITLVFIRSKERKIKRNVPLTGIVLLLALTVLFTLISNLFRILALIIFNAPAGSISHDIVGLAAMVIYTVVPIYFIVKKFHLLAPDKGGVKSRFVSIRTFVFQLGLGLCVCVASFSTKGYQYRSQTTFTEITSMPGFSQGQVAFSGKKFFNESTLVYVKPCMNFWRSDHNPVICWKASGYVFQQEKKALIAGKEVYTAKLKKGDDIIYTSWWFQNDQNITTSQLKWRWDMAQNESSYALINVSCSSQATLKNEIVNVMNLYKESLVSMATLDPEGNQVAN